jgi:hypothetical protein
MSAPVVTKNPSAVLNEVQSIYRAIFPDGDPTFVPRGFAWVLQCFNGQYKDYRPLDAAYHDVEHTMQGTLCMMRLLHGYHRAAAEPRLTEPMFQLGLLAILFHDTGYLRKADDLKGTGAKYTITHVERSLQFAAEFLGEKGLGRTEIRAVQHMIHCTGIDSALASIKFQSDLEKILGHALGTADLLGQMAARDYVEKLPVLFSEFAEAAHYSHDHTHFVAMYVSAEDLMRKTPAFWDNYVKPKLDRDFSGLHRYLNEPFPGGPNPYFQQIDAGMARLRKRLAAA